MVGLSTPYRRASGRCRGDLCERLERCRGVREYM